MNPLLSAESLPSGRSEDQSVMQECGTEAVANTLQDGIKAALWKLLLDLPIDTAAWTNNPVEICGDTRGGDLATIFLQNLKIQQPVDEWSYVGYSIGHTGAAGVWQCFQDIKCHKCWIWKHWKYKFTYTVAHCWTAIDNNITSLSDSQSLMIWNLKPFCWW